MPVTLKVSVKALLPPSAGHQLLRPLLRRPSACLRMNALQDYACRWMRVLGLRYAGICCSQRRNLCADPDGPVQIAGPSCISDPMLIGTSARSLQTAERWNGNNVRASMHLWHHNASLAAISARVRSHSLQLCEPSPSTLTGCIQGLHDAAHGCYVMSESDHRRRCS